MKYILPIKIFLIFGVVFTLLGCSQKITPIAQSKQYYKIASHDFTVSARGETLQGFKDNKYKVIGTTKINNNVYEVLLMNDVNFPTHNLLLGKDGKLFKKIMMQDPIYGPVVTMYSFEITPSDLSFK